jgi:galactonate dehydratase
MPPAITRIEPTVVKVSNKTNWVFVKVETSDGIVGTGEATLSGQEEAMLSITRDYSEKLIGSPESSIEVLAGETNQESARAPRAVVSALEQAGWDIRGLRQGMPVHTLLGGAKRERIPIYANINRRCTDRSSAGFAANAREAVGAGYSLIKIAPFDGLQPDLGTKEGDALFKAGMERIEVSCEAAGPDVQVLVDCHWRLTQTHAEELIKQAATLGLYWVECPLPENPHDCSNLVRLRSLKDSLGVRLAGAEQGTNFDYFKKFVDAGVYDVIMPDVKYAGGISELIRIAEMANDSGVDFSPHNPSGPLCHLASLHIAAAAPDFLVLEHQFDESPMFMELCPGAVPEIVNGWSALPTAPGIGFNL